MAQHSPLPWEAFPSGEVRDCNGSQVALTYGDIEDPIPEAEATAAYVVKACNAHPGLVDAIEETIRTLEETVAQGGVDSTTGHLLSRKAGDLRVLIYA